MKFLSTVVNCYWPDQKIQIYGYQDKWNEHGYKKRCRNDEKINFTQMHSAVFIVCQYIIN